MFKEWYHEQKTNAPSSQYNIYEKKIQIQILSSTGAFYLSHATASISDCALLYSSSLFASEVRRCMTAGSSFSNEASCFPWQKWHKKHAKVRSPSFSYDICYCVFFKVKTIKENSPPFSPTLWRNDQVSCAWPRAPGNKLRTWEWYAWDSHIPCSHRTRQW